MKISIKLISFRLFSNLFFFFFQRMETDDLRKVPVGVDSEGALYWYFYGTRLYREVPDPSTQPPAAQYVETMIILI